MEPVDGVEAPCPLCGEAFTDDAAYAGHLADAHGLVDDDGAATTVEHALIVSGIAGDRELAIVAAEEAAASKSLTDNEAATTIHPSRIYDPHQDDSRFKPIVVGLAGMLLLGAVGLGLLASDDDAQEDGAEVATDEGAAADDGALGGGSPTTGGGATAAGDPALTAAAGVVVDPSIPPAGDAAPVATDAPPAPPTTAPPAVAEPPPTSPPATAPPTTPPPTAPPTTAPPFAAPSVSGARIDSCQRSGPDATWTFSYVLSGGSGWAPATGATALGGGRYSERRSGKASRGFPSTSIQVVDTATGSPRSITLSPSLAGTDCR